MKELEYELGERKCVTCKKEIDVGQVTIPRNAKLLALHVSFSASLQNLDSEFKSFDADILIIGSFFQLTLNHMWLLVNYRNIFIEPL